MTHRILFVCLGNICRSPTAEAVFRAMAESAGLDVIVDGAATSGWHIGSPPDPRAQTAAAARGYELSGLLVRQIAFLTCWSKPAADWSARLAQLEQFSAAVWPQSL